MRAQLNNARISDYLPNYHLWRGWAEAFQASKTLDIFAAYPVTWFVNYSGDLRQFVTNGKHIRVILADPDREATVTELAHRFDKPAEHVALVDH